jgi:hypothetical protein
MSRDSAILALCWVGWLWLDLTSSHFGTILMPERTNTGFYTIDHKTRMAEINLRLRHEQNNSRSTKEIELEVIEL